MIASATDTKMAIGTRFKTDEEPKDGPRKDPDWSKGENAQDRRSQDKSHQG